MHDGKPIFLPRASSKTCHTFPKRVFLKIICVQCKLDSKSRFLYFDSLDRLIKNTLRYIFNIEKSAEFIGSELL